MLIFWERRLVFLATPKAGSTAIEAALEGLANLAVQRPAELKHTDFRTYRQFIAPWLQSVTGDAFTTVALMREPLSWLQSWYRFRQRDDQDDPDHAMTGVSFAEFSRLYASGTAGSLTDIGSQSTFLTDGPARVDRIFRYEDMEAFTDFLEDRLDCALRLPRVNVPPAADVTLTPDQHAELMRALDPDLAIYRAL